MLLKRTKYNIILFSAFFILLCISSCQQESINCTMEWRALTVKVIDSLNNPIILDDYYTTNKTTGDIFRLKDIDSYSDSVQKSQGEYFVVTDNQKHWAKNGYCKVIFKGIMNNREVVSEEFGVTANVCHIGDLIGKTTIVIDR